MHYAAFVDGSAVGNVLFSYFGDPREYAAAACNI